MSAIQAMVTCVLTVLCFHIVNIFGLSTLDEIYQVLGKERLSGESYDPTPFPKIKGPKSKHDKIAIIGAGPSGIHMAYKLKKEGFTNVTIFERHPYIGGKSRTVYHRNVPHEMGTVYTQPDYTEIYRLVNELDAGHLLPMPSPTVWVNKQQPTPITSLENSLLVLLKLRPDITNTTVAVGLLQGAIRKYINIHKALFGTYEGELMPRPSKAILAEVNMTFLDFLQRHDIEALKGLFMSAMTAQGYGHIDEISALYGIMWMTPRFLEAIAKPPSPEVKSVVKILSKGFQFLWAEIARQNNLDVKLSSPVTKVVRLRKGFLVRYKRCGKYYDDMFHFIITSPTMKFMSNVIPFDSDVKRLFQKTFHHYYTTTLADTDYGVNRGRTPQDYYAFNMLSKEENSVWVHRDSYSSLNFITGANYTNGDFPDGPDGLFRQTSVYYQHAKRKQYISTIERKLKAHISNVEQSENVALKRAITWSYFPRYSVSAMASGILWDIFNKQGEHNMWYIGSSVSFESVKSVVEYNNLLIRQYSCNV